MHTLIASTRKHARPVRRALLACALLAARAESQDAPPMPFSEASAATASVASEYMKAYFDKDYPTIERLLAEQVVFDDLGGPSPTHVVGRTEVIRYLRGVFGSLDQLRMTAVRTIYSGTSAVIVLDAAWTYRALDGSRAAVDRLPMVIALEIGNGRVVSQRDYADLAGYAARQRPE